MTRVAAPFSSEHFIILCPASAQGELQGKPCHIFLKVPAAQPSPHCLVCCVHFIIMEGTSVFSAFCF